MDEIIAEAPAVIEAERAARASLARFVEICGAIARPAELLIYAAARQTVGSPELDEKAIRTLRHVEATFDQFTTAALPLINQIKGNEA